MWKVTEGADARVQPELVPDHIWGYLAEYTLKACKRFYADPKNRAKFEAWKAAREVKYEKEHLK